MYIEHCPCRPKYWRFWFADPTLASKCIQLLDPHLALPCSMFAVVDSPIQKKQSLVSDKDWNYQKTRVFVSDPKKTKRLLEMFPKDK